MTETVRKIVSFIESNVKAAGCKGTVVGVSGGIDSAVVLGLCKLATPGAVLGVIMPCHSDPIDKEYAVMVLDAFGIPYKEVVLDSVYDEFIKSVGGNASRLAIGNIKPRLRMITLYYHANMENSLVVGTGNKDELTMGYFTKYGDGGVDMLPLGSLTKAEVRAIARELSVPQPIIDRVPTAGLWPGQTDEQEMGISYDTIDAYLRGEPVEQKYKDMIEQRRARNAHKLRTPPIA
jgi:NAD+ synthase